MYMHPPSWPLMILIANVPKQTGWNRDGEIKEMALLKARARGHAHNPNDSTDQAIQCS